MSYAQTMTKVIQKSNLTTEKKIKGRILVFVLCFSYFKKNILYFHSAFKLTHLTCLWYCATKKSPCQGSQGIITLPCHCYIWGPCVAAIPVSGRLTDPAWLWSTGWLSDLTSDLPSCYAQTLLGDCCWCLTLAAVCRPNPDTYQLVQHHNSTLTCLIWCQKAWTTLEAGHHRWIHAAHLARYCWTVWLTVMLLPSLLAASPAPQSGSSACPWGSLSAPLHATSAQLPLPAALSWLKWKHTLKSNQIKEKKSSELIERSLNPQVFVGLACKTVLGLLSVDTVLWFLA